MMDGQVDPLSSRTRELSIVLREKAPVTTQQAWGATERGFLLSQSDDGADPYDDRWAGQEAGRETNAL